MMMMIFNYNLKHITEKKEPLHTQPNSLLTALLERGEFRVGHWSIMSSLDIVTYYMMMMIFA